MPPPLPKDHPPKGLWQKIEQFELDDPTAAFPFSKKLAQQNNWNDEFTQLTIKEYKRFVYLCCTLPDGASPSYIIDQVWHLHLCYTVNYWEDFCEQTLSRRLHHHPSKGGTAQSIHHHDWYERTRIKYRETFNEYPPEAIWRPTQKRAARPGLLIRIRPLIPKRQATMAAAAFTILPTLSGCKADFGSFMPSLIMLGILILFGATASQNKDGATDGGSSGSCGSSCSSSCSSSCGGGCGGCGS